LTFYKKNFEKVTSEADFFETELFFLLIWGGGWRFDITGLLALRLTAG